MEADTLNHKRCPRCEQHKPTTEFYKNSTKKDGKSVYCKQCHIDSQMARRVSNPTWSIFQNKKGQAKQKGIEFNLIYEEVEFPTLCPVLGFELDYRRNRGIGKGSMYNSPSFDRIDPTKGYVKGNVLIISNLANTIKSNATVDQLKKVAAFYEQLIPQTGASHADQDH